MRVDRQEIEEFTIVSIAEAVEVDLGNAEEFKEAVLGALEGARSVVLDATLVEFFDSAGMGSLLSIQKKINAGGGRIALAGLNQAILEIFQMVGFNVVFQIHPDVPQAISALRSS